MWYWERHWRLIFAVVAKLMLFRTDRRSVCAYVGRMPKKARLWIVFAIAAMVLGCFVTPPAAAGVLGGLAFFIETEKPNGSGWLALLYLVATALGGALLAYFGGHFTHALGWGGATMFLCHGVQWVSTPQTQPPPQG